MSFISDFEAALEYIEDHLTSEIDFNIAARKAKCSFYHFQRMFSSLAGIPLSEYIRRRKMTLAALEVQNSNEKIIDIALKYGYDSHSSFTRAFQSIQGITPSAARADGTILTAFPPLTFQFTLKGAEAMQYKIIETESYQVFGTDAIQVDGWNTEAFLEYADRVIENGSHDAINVAAGFPGLAGEMIEKDEWDVTRIHLLQLFHYWDDKGNKYCMYGWEVPESGVDQHFTVLNIPKATWVVINTLLNGDRAGIAQCYKDLYTNWFPTSGYEQAPGFPIIEKYTLTNAELWMPITKK